MKLYPIHFNGKEYFRKDCHPTFVAFYTCIEALRCDFSVYIADGVAIQPDGTIL